MPKKKGGQGEKKKQELTKDLDSINCFSGKLGA